MMKYDRFEEVPLDRIDGSDKRFAFAFPENVEELLPSVKASGVLVPLFLQDLGTGLFRIVCGHRRVAAAKRVGIRQVPARVVGVEVGDLDLYLAGIRENLAVRPVNNIERGRCLHRLVSDFGVDRATRNEVMNQLGISPCDRLYKQYAGLVRLTGKLQNYVVLHNIPVRVCTRIAAWPETGQRSLEGMLQRVTFGGNALRKLVDFLEEIALREKTTPGKILERPEISLLRENRDLTSTQIRERVEEVLREFRFPELTEQCATLNSLLKKVCPREVQLFLPSFLEGEKVEVHFRFGSVDELRERTASLNGIADREETGKILASLKQLNS
ncbi:MAG: ParB N-terminal domain-containing protein [Deltaproteobacteria bacterium]|nr:ParB N-terminal domain-containing protein [Deltaproteobacteria bacterium]